MAISSRENPVLVKFREVQGDVSAASRAGDWAFFGLIGNTAYGTRLGATPHEIAGASRVLVRLAGMERREDEG